MTTPPQAEGHPSATAQTCPRAGARAADTTGRLAVVAGDAIGRPAREAPPVPGSPRGEPAADAARAPRPAATRRSASCRSPSSPSSSSRCRSSASLVRAPWRSLPDDLTAPGVLTALRLSLVCSLGALGRLAGASACRSPGCSRASRSRPQRRPRPGDAADGAAAGRRRRRAAPRLRPQRHRRPVAGPLVRHHLAVHDGRGAMHGRDVRGHAVPRHHRRGRIRAMDRRYEDAAATLGAGRWTTFRRVTLPLIAPALARRRGALAGRARSASSARPSPSPATCPARPRPCRWPCTWRCRTTPTPRSPSAW